MKDTKQLQYLLDKANEELFAIRRGKKKFPNIKAKREAVDKLIQKIRLIMDTWCDIDMENSEEAMREAKNVQR